MSGREKSSLVDYDMMLKYIYNGLLSRHLRVCMHAMSYIQIVHDRTSIYVAIASLVFGCSHPSRVLVFHNPAAGCVVAILRSSFEPIDQPPFGACHLGSLEHSTTPTARRPTSGRAGRAVSVFRV